MKRNLSRYIYGVTLLVLAMGPTACKKNFTDPSSVPSQDAFGNPQAMTGVAIGLQRAYTAGRASSLFNRVVIDGILTNQLTVSNQGNVPEFQLQTGGGTVDGTNTMVNGLWTSSNKIIYDADNVLNSARGLGDPAYASGLIGYTSIFKALALGDIALFWEQAPASNGQNVAFQARTAALQRAIVTIDTALNRIAATPVPASYTAVLPGGAAGIDIPNTLHALKARYSLYLGNYATALAEANLVDLTKKSVLVVNGTNPNPLFESLGGGNVTTMAATFGLPAGLQPDPADKRIPFYYSASTSSKMLGFGATSTTSYPLYLPGEMTLIKAEAYARMTPPDLANAVIELNKVVTKLRSADPFGIGAELPAVAPVGQQAILDEIYRQRGIELSLSGLRLEDMRRFARPVAERKRSFLPYPFQERDNNPNTPPDPAF
ncbi:MAG: RagB/SusD family nutrient uptake outer membrane protein [Chitinophagaceae bacterium]|nr:MAG: RagB/SusD family nutrient uptake outer membrane protein [Chitinophagaceae bacterium]